MKLFTFDRYEKMAESKPLQHGLGHSKGFLTFIGACELLGGVRVILLVAFGILPILTSIAAMGLGIIMAGATIYHFAAKRIADGPADSPGHVLVRSFQTRI